MKNPPLQPRRREFLGGAAAALGMGCAASTSLGQESAAQGRAPGAAAPGAVLVGSANALPGMRQFYPALVAGADPLDVAIDVVKVTEANPDDHSVGLGGLPNEDGVVQLDAAVMHGPTHNAGGVACLENIQHPSEVARLVMERTDHCLLVGEGAYRFARQHGLPHTELLTEEARRIWLRWKETMSTSDDRFPPQVPKSAPDVDGGAGAGAKQVRGGSGGNGGRVDSGSAGETANPWGTPEGRVTGTIHCSALSARGELACTTTTSGLAYKIPGRVGDSPLIGCGLYCDQDVGSAGSTGRGEAVILSTGSATIIELLRQGATPEEAGLGALERITRQAQRAAAWQPGLVDERGVPTFGVHFYVVDATGRTAGVTLRGTGSYAVADPEGGPRHERLVALHG